jgi:hypothetical protein
LRSECFGEYSAGVDILSGGCACPSVSLYLFLSLPRARCRWLDKDGDGFVDLPDVFVGFAKVGVCGAWCGLDCLLLWWCVPHRRARECQVLTSPVLELADTYFDIFDSNKAGRMDKAEVISLLYASTRHASCKLVCTPC